MAGREEPRGVSLDPTGERSFLSGRLLLLVALYQADESLFQVARLLAFHVLDPVEVSPAKCWGARFENRQDAVDHFLDLSARAALCGLMPKSSVGGQPAAWLSAADSPSLGLTIRRTDQSPGPSAVSWTHKPSRGRECGRPAHPGHRDPRCRDQGPLLAQRRARRPERQQAVDQG